MQERGGRQRGVLDAMPVQLLARHGGRWLERGVVRNAAGDGWAWSRPRDRAAGRRSRAGEHDYLTEIHPRPGLRRDPGGTGSSAGPPS